VRQKYLALTEIHWVKLSNIEEIKIQPISINYDQFSLEIRLVNRRDWIRVATGTEELCKKSMQELVYILETSETSQSPLS